MAESVHHGQAYGAAVLTHYKSLLGLLQRQLRKPVSKHCFERLQLQHFFSKEATFSIFAITLLITAPLKFTIHLAYARK